MLRHSTCLLVGAGLLFCSVVFPISKAMADTNLSRYRDIVVPAKASREVREAAEDLQYHLQKITGRDFALVDKAEGEGLHFFVGAGLTPEIEKAVDALPAEGWLIRSVPEGLVLAGNESATSQTRALTNPYHAVSLFLEKYCGVRWLWPGASGEVIPRNPNLTIPTLDKSGAPVMRRRQIMSGTPRDPQMAKDAARWRDRVRLGNQINANFGHAWATVIPPDLYFEKHPEWFGLVAGKRIPRQLCISNPQLRDEFFKRLISLPMNQKLDIVSVSANDGYGFCECDLCKAKGSIGDSYWDFVNDIAQRVKKAKPGLGVGTFAYSFGRQPPEKIAKLPDNVYLSMTTYATQLMRPEGRKEYKEFTDGWKSKGVKIVMREYWGMHYWLDLPVVYPDEISSTIKTATAAGMIGAYGEAGKNFATQAPNYYMVAHQLWDPDADPKAIMDEFYGAFGPAEKPVRAYFDTMHRAAHDTWNRYKLEGHYTELVTRYGVMFTPAVMKEATAHLDEAAKIAANDADLKAKIDFLRVGCDYTALMGELLDLYEKLGRTGFPLEAFEWEATAEARRKAVKSPNVTDDRDYFEQRMKEPFHYTLADKDAWLQRAWDLGQQRIVMLRNCKNSFALNEGLYAYTVKVGIRQWQQTIGKYLGKAPEEIETIRDEQAQNTSSPQIAAAAIP